MRKRIVAILLTGWMATTVLTGCEEAAATDALREEVGADEAGYTEFAGEAGSDTTESAAADAAQEFFAAASAAAAGDADIAAEEAATESTEIAEDNTRDSTTDQRDANAATAVGKTAGEPAISGKASASAADVTPEEAAAALAAALSQMTGEEVHAEDISDAQALAEATLANEGIDLNLTPEELQRSLPEDFNVPEDEAGAVALAEQLAEELRREGGSNFSEEIPQETLAQYAAEFQALAKAYPASEDLNALTKVTGAQELLQVYEKLQAEHPEAAQELFAGFESYLGQLDPDALQSQIIEEYVRNYIEQKYGDRFGKLQGFVKEAMELYRSWDDEQQREARIFITKVMKQHQDKDTTANNAALVKLLVQFGGLTQTEAEEMVEYGDVLSRIYLENQTDVTFQ